jgi:hypothetical protein
MTAESQTNGNRPRDQRAAADPSRAERATQRVRESNRQARATFARPQAYDESGFPIATTPSTFAERVRRLLFG